MRALMFAGALAVATIGGMVAGAEGTKTYPFDGAFDDAAFGVESAIVDRGLVIDSVSHVGAMLERTRAETGGETIFKAADVFQFCSATLSRKVMEVDPLNISHCPYGVFVTEDAAGQVSIGYRMMPEGAMKEVEALLDAIAREAADE